MRCRFNVSFFMLLIMTVVGDRPIDRFKKMARGSNVKMAKRGAQRSLIERRRVETEEEHLFPFTRAVDGENAEQREEPTSPSPSPTAQVSLCDYKCNHGDDGGQCVSYTATQTNSTTEKQPGLLPCPSKIANDVFWCRALACNSNPDTSPPCWFCYNHLLEQPNTQTSNACYSLGLTTHKFISEEEFEALNQRISDTNSTSQEALTAVKQNTGGSCLITSMPGSLTLGAITCAMGVPSTWYFCSQTAGLYVLAAGAALPVTNILLASLYLRIEKCFTKQIHSLKAEETKKQQAKVAIGSQFETHWDDVYIWSIGKTDSTDFRGSHMSLPVYTELDDKPQ